jgi:hypothetical protein
LAEPKRFLGTFGSGLAARNREKFVFGDGLMVGWIKRMFRKHIAQDVPLLPLALSTSINVCAAP